MKIHRRRMLKNLAATSAILLSAACDARSPITEIAEATEPRPAISEHEPDGSRRLALAGLMETHTAPGGRSEDAVLYAEVEIRFNGLSNNGRNAAIQNVAKFRDLTGLIVRMDFANWAGSYQVIVNELAAKTAPDVWCGREWWVPALAERGHLLAIDEYLEHWHGWEDYFPAARADVEYGGNVQAVPFRSRYRGSPAIRPSLFESAGIPVSVPSNCSELNEVAPKLTIKDCTQFQQVGFALEHHAQVYEDWLLQAGGNVLSDSLELPTNFTVEGVQALTQHVKYGTAGNNDGGGRPDRRLHSFCSGEVAIQQLWATDIGNCELNAPAMFDDLIIGKPFEGPISRSASIQFDKYMPNKSPKNFDATFETIKFFASPSVIEDMFGFEGRAMPCRVGMEGFHTFRSEPYKSLAENAKLGIERQIVPNQLDVESAITAWVKRASAKSTSVGDALRGMDDDIAGLIPEM